MKKVKIVDSMPSSGKTQWMIDYIGHLTPEKKVIYITPFLTETERIKKSCKGKNFQLPHAKHGKGSKLTHFKRLLKERRNIASTHALFSGVDQETMDLIEAGNYMLVLDEVMEVITPLDMLEDESDLSEDERKRIMKRDMEVLISKKFVSIDKHYLISWNENGDTLSKYQTLKEAVDRDLVYFSASSLLLQAFPPELFEADIFNEIFVMTYQFDYQIQSYYFRFFDIPYEKYGVVKHRKTKQHKYQFSFVSYMEYLEYDQAKRLELKELFNICDSRKLNSIGVRATEYGDSRVALSKSDYRRREKKDLKDIQRKSISYLSGHLGDRASEVMWTCFKDYKDEIKHARFPDKHFVALNARATNDYRKKSGIIYLVNRFVNPYLPHLFKTKGIDFNGEAFALAEMLQFIFRSQIRDDKPINVYIPSERMRELLIRWLEGEY